MNKRRAEKGLSTLDVITIGLEKDEGAEDNVEEAKVSSSNRRIRMLGETLRPPLKDHDGQGPYVIGKTSFF